MKWWMWVAGGVGALWLVGRNAEQVSPTMPQINAEKTKEKALQKVYDMAYKQVQMFLADPNSKSGGIDPIIRKGVEVGWRAVMRNGEGEIIEQAEFWA